MSITQEDLQPRNRFARFLLDGDTNISRMAEIYIIDEVSEEWVRYTHIEICDPRDIRVQFLRARPWTFTRFNINKIYYKK